MKAALDLFGGSGVKNLDCRQDGSQLGDGAARELAVQLHHRRHRAGRRAAAGRDQPAPGSAGAERPHPQDLARTANLKVGVVGEAADLTYRLRAPGRRRRRAEGPGRARRRLRQGAQGAPSGRRSSWGRALWPAPTARRCCARSPSSAWALGVVREGWNGFNVLHTAAARVGGLDLGFVPGEGGLDAPPRWPPRARSTCCSCWAPTRSTSRGTDAFVVYLGTPRRRRRPPRRRDPAGRGLHRKGRPLRQHRGPGAARRAGGLPQGRGRARTGRSCARCPSGWARSCPTTRLDQLRAKLFADHPTFGQIDYAPGSTPAAFDLAEPRRRGELSRRAVRQPDQGLLPHQPDRARQRDHGRVLRRCAPGARRSRRSRADAARLRFRDPAARLDPAAPSGRSCWSLVGVLHLPAPSCILARPQDLGRRADAQRPQCGRALRPAAVLRRLAASSCSRSSVIPAGADKFVFLLAPLISVILAFGAWAAIPLAPGWVVSNINVGILYLFAISSLGVYGIIMGGWASNSKYPVPGRPALGGADGLLRGLDRLRHRSPCPAGRLDEPADHRRAAGRRVLELERARRRRAEGPAAGAWS